MQRDTCCHTAMWAAKQGSTCIIKSAPTFPRAFASLALGNSLEHGGEDLGPRATLGVVGLVGELGIAWAASWRKMRSLLRRVQRSSSLPSAGKSKLSSTMGLGFLGLRPRLLGLESSRSTLAGGSSGSSGVDLLPCRSDGNFRILLSLSESVNSNTAPLDKEATINITTNRSS